MTVTRFPARCRHEWVCIHGQPWHDGSFCGPHHCARCGALHPDAPDDQAAAA